MEKGNIAIVTECFVQKLTDAAFAIWQKIREKPCPDNTLQKNSEVAKFIHTEGDLLGISKGLFILVNKKIISHLAQKHLDDLKQNIEKSPKKLEGTVLEYLEKNLVYDENDPIGNEINEDIYKIRLYFELKYFDKLPKLLSNILRKHKDNFYQHFLEFYELVQKSNNLDLKFTYASLLFDICNSYKSNTENLADKIIILSEEIISQNPNYSCKNKAAEVKNPIELQKYAINMMITHSDEDKKLFREGIECFNNQKYEEAVAKLEKVSSTYHNVYGCSFYLAKCHLQLKHAYEAKKYFNHADQNKELWEKHTEFMLLLSSQINYLPCVCANDLKKNLQATLRHYKNHLAKDPSIFISTLNEIFPVIKEIFKNSSSYTSKIYQDHFQELLKFLTQNFPENQSFKDTKKNINDLIENSINKQKKSEDTSANIREELLKEFEEEQKKGIGAGKKGKNKNSTHTKKQEGNKSSSPTKGNNDSSNNSTPKNKNIKKSTVTSKSLEELQAEIGNRNAKEEHVTKASSPTKKSSASTRKKKKEKKSDTNTLNAVKVEKDSTQEEKTAINETNEAIPLKETSTSLSPNPEELQKPASTPEFYNDRSISTSTQTTLYPKAKSEETQTDVCKKNTDTNNLIQQENNQFIGSLPKSNEICRSLASLIDTAIKSKEHDVEAIYNSCCLLLEYSSCNNLDPTNLYKNYVQQTLQEMINHSLEVAQSYRKKHDTKIYYLRQAIKCYNTITSIISSNNEKELFKIESTRQELVTTGNALIQQNSGYNLIQELEPLTLNNNFNNYPCLPFQHTPYPQYYGHPQYTPQEEALHESHYDSSNNDDNRDYTHSTYSYNQPHNSQRSASLLQRQQNCIKSPKYMNKKAVNYKKFTDIENEYSKDEGEDKFFLHATKCFEEAFEEAGKIMTHVKNSASKIEEQIKDKIDGKHAIIYDIHEEPDSQYNDDMYEIQSPIARSDISTMTPPELENYRNSTTTNYFHFPYYDHKITTAPTSSLAGNAGNSLDLSTEAAAS